MDEHDECVDAAFAYGDGLMAKCDVCGNDYDKAFQVVSAQGSRTRSTASSAPSMLLPRHAPIAIARSSGTASRREAHSIVVRTVPGEWRFWRRRSRVESALSVQRGLSRRRTASKEHGAQEFARHPHRPINCLNQISPSQAARF